MSPELEAKLGEAMLAHALREGKHKGFPKEIVPAGEKADLKAQRLWRSGCTQAQIAREMNRPQSWVLNALRRTGEKP